MRGPNANRLARGLEARRFGFRCGSAWWTVACRNIERCQAVPTCLSSLCLCCCAHTCRVWYKHRDNYFLPTYAELTSMALVRAANTVYESVVFSSIV